MSSCILSQLLLPRLHKVDGVEARDGGSLMFSKLDGWRSSPWAMRPSTLRAGLLSLLAACVLLSACTPGGSTSSQGASSPSTSAESTPGSTETGTAVDPEDVPPDDTDYSKDVGNTPQQYDYEPELEPPESVVATLCNLNQGFFKGLRETESGLAVADGTLRTSMVGLGDLTDYWETLRVQYPDAAADIDTALAVREQWMTALVDQDNGDQAGAKKAMAAAEKLIKKLPEVAAVGCIR